MKIRRSKNLLGGTHTHTYTRPPKIGVQLHYYSRIPSQRRKEKRLRYIVYKCDWIRVLLSVMSSTRGVLISCARKKSEFAFHQHLYDDAGPEVTLEYMKQRISKI